MKTILKETLKPSLSRLMNRKEVATMLGVSARTVLEMAHRKEIPYVFVGRQIRFSVDRIATWIDAKTQEATA